MMIIKKLLFHTIIVLPLIISVHSTIAAPVNQDTFGTLTFDNDPYDGETYILPGKHTGQIVIEANNFTLDCNGQNIFYESSDEENFANIIAVYGDNVTIKNCRVRGKATTAIKVVQAKSATIDNNDIRGAGFKTGIRLTSFSNNSTIKNNSVVGTSGSGLFLGSSDGFTVESGNIEGNVLVNNRVGIWTPDSNDLKIKGNIIHFNSTGISCLRCQSTESSIGVDRFLISENIFRKNGIAIKFSESKHVSVWVNIIASSTENGISLGNTSYTNKIWSNIIADNGTYGIRFSDGGPRRSNPTGNNIDNNVFFDNEEGNVYYAGNEENNTEINSYYECQDKSVIGHMHEQFRC